MDIFSHGLWTAVVYNKVRWPQRWWGILFGVMPDLLSFGLLFLQSLVLDLHRIGPPNLASLPPYIFVLYNISHSLSVWLLIFILIWLILRRPWWPILGAILHILIDIPSHEANFFPTPFLWPWSDFTVNGYSWAHPIFLVVNYSLLVIVYGLWFLWKRRKSRVVSDQNLE
jgi:hypothetical protein